MDVLNGLFAASNGVAIAGWASLALAPRWKGTRQGVTVAVSALLAIAYVALLLVFLGEADGGFGSLDDVVLLFSYRHVALIGWIHYLAFDLFVGTWIVQDWNKTGHRTWWMLPVLGLTFMLGPAGLLAYLVVRGSVTRNLHVSLAG